jgi:hypothetical protein
MQAGKLNKRVRVYRQTSTSDGYGGVTESALILNSTIWAQKKELKSEIVDQDRGQKRLVQLELIVRKRTADSLQIDTDLLELESQSGKYRINAIEEYDQDFYSLVKCTKHGN